MNRPLQLRHRAVMERNPGLGNVGTKVCLNCLLGAMVEVLLAYGGALVLEALDELALHLLSPQELERVGPRLVELVSIAIQP